MLKKLTGNKTSSKVIEREALAPNCRLACGTSSYLYAEIAWNNTII